MRAELPAIYITAHDVVRPDRRRWAFSCASWHCTHRVAIGSYMPFPEFEDPPDRILVEAWFSVRKSCLTEPQLRASRTSAMRTVREARPLDCY